MLQEDVHGGRHNKRVARRQMSFCDKGFQCREEETKLIHVSVQSSFKTSRALCFTALDMMPIFRIFGEMQKSENT
jgi:hypothetical protein